VSRAARLTVSPWLVSRRFDLGVFLLPALAALGLSAFQAELSPTGALPLPLWIVTVLLVDVAHVWATIWRTYLDPIERARRPLLYSLIPIGAYAIGVLLHSISSATFWTALAYLAVFHFVRQQYGWVALYERASGPTSRVDRVIDSAAIYAATLFPILWWHAHLPRSFDWFVQGDFLRGLSVRAADLAWPVYLLALGAFGLRQIQLALAYRVLHPGKVVVVATTALCWGLGIIAADSDFVFTVTNVLIHGVPYFGVVWIYGRSRSPAYLPHTIAARVFGGGAGLGVFFSVLAALAYAEEFAWDRLVWHDHAAIFPGPSLDLGAALLAAVVPLLALPQATHYLLDAWIWKTREHPALLASLGAK
jgi:hypothetical protein